MASIIREETSSLLEAADAEPGPISGRQPGETDGAPVLYDSGAKGWSLYKRDLYMLSFSFLLVFSAFGATQNLESSLNTVSRECNEGGRILSVAFNVCFFICFCEPLNHLRSPFAFLLPSTMIWVHVLMHFLFRY